MKLPFIFVLLLGIPIASKSQCTLGPEDLGHYRIQLNNRSNRHLKDIPRQLLEGYCKGIYRAYYPNAIFNEVNFGDFMDHFRWSEPVLNESILCGEDYCSSQAFRPLFERFDMYLDFYEHSYFNQGTSLTERKVEYLQLVYRLETGGQEYIFRGPLFRMDEIENRLFVANEFNKGEIQSLGHAFKLARYFATEVGSPDFKHREKRTWMAEDNNEN